MPDDSSRREKQRHSAFGALILLIVLWGEGCTQVPIALVSSPPNSHHRMGGPLATECRRPWRSPTESGSATRPSISGTPPFHSRQKDPARSADYSRRVRPGPRRTEERAGRRSAGLGWRLIEPAVSRLCTCGQLYFGYLSRRDVRDERGSPLTRTCRSTGIPMTRATPDETLARFAALQSRLRPLFQRLKHDTGAPRTVVVVPGLSLDPEVLATIGAARHYEERMLSMLMLLRMPRTRIVFVTSTPLAPSIVDYYLHLLSGVPTAHARSRLMLLSANDASTRSLTAKLLERPRLLRRIRAAIGDPAQRISRYSMRRIWSATWRSRSTSRSMDAIRSSPTGERRAAAAPRSSERESRLPRAART